MDTTILQVPVKRTVKKRAAFAAEEMGFSSLQEAVRIFLNKLAQKKINVSFEEVVELSPQAARRYDKMLDDIESGKVVTKAFAHTEDLIKYLNK